MVQGGCLRNILTVDLEEAFHRNDLTLAPQQSGAMRGRIVAQTRRLLELLESGGVKGTFFVVGEVAERYPKVITWLARQGHEIGLHGYTHRLVYEQGEEEFVQETRQGKRLLEQITGEAVIGFRAPSWSITERSLWALRILSEMGFRYDSSILPARACLGGISKANPLIHRRGEGVIEVPPSIFRCGPLRLPFSGGLYLRCLPYWFVKRCIEGLNSRGLPAVVYLHPWELDPDLPRLRLNWKGRFALYYNLQGMQAKVKRLVAEFRFAPVREVLADVLRG